MLLIFALDALGVTRLIFGCVSGLLCNAAGGNVWIYRDSAGLLR